MFALFQHRQDVATSSDDPHYQRAISKTFVPTAVRLRASVRKLGASVGSRTWRERFLVLTGERIWTYHSEQAYNLEAMHGQVRSMHGSAVHRLPRTLARVCSVFII